MATQTKTMLKAIVKYEFPLEDLCKEEHIPYFICHVKVTKDLVTGKKKKDAGLPKGYNTMTFEQTEEWNKGRENKPGLNHLAVMLRNSPYMVVDFDDDKNLEERYARYGGNTFTTKSISKKMPHLWRRKHDSDISKNKIKVNGDEVDFIYEYVFENKDAQIITYEEGGEAPIFDYLILHPDPVTKNAEPTITVHLTERLISVQSDDKMKLMEHLRNIADKFKTPYDDWLKIGFSCKNIFAPEEWMVIFEGWSGTVDDGTWDKKFDYDGKCGIPTILDYSKKSDEAEFNAIEQKYRRKSSDAGRDLLLKNIATEQKPNAYPLYDEMKADFEKTHSKIIALSVYAKVLDDGAIQFFKEAQFNTSYKHLTCCTEAFDDSGTMKLLQKAFLPLWTTDPNMKLYDSVGVFPPPMETPKGYLNLWTGFDIAKIVGDYERDESALEVFKKHVAVLCNHQEEVTDYVIRWIAQMFQFPAVKTTALTFISNEGAGKGTLLHLLNLMMGDKKVFETTKPSRDVWGSFNNLMASSFLVNLNEMALKEATDAEGYIKALITDNAMTINNKGMDAYKIKSFHRFIITTNNADPIKVKKNDRRNVVIQSSDELIGNAKYFIDINKMFENVNARRTIYDYLMSIEDLENFKTDVRPVTEYQQDMCEITRDNYDRWIENLAVTTEEEELKLTGVEQYRLFSEWVTKNGIKHETNVIKMCLGIKRLNLPAIECGLRTREFRYTKYNITELKKHYGVGCLLL